MCCLFSLETDLAVLLVPLFYQSAYLDSSGAPTRNVIVQAPPWPVLLWQAHITTTAYSCQAHIKTTAYSGQVHIRTNCKPYSGIWYCEMRVGTNWQASATGQNVLANSRAVEN